MENGETKLLRGSQDAPLNVRCSERLAGNNGGEARSSVIKEIPQPPRKHDSPEAVNFQQGEILIAGVQGKRD